MKNELIESFKDTIFSQSVADIVSEYGELTIDSVLKDETLKQIPIINTVAFMYKFVVGLKERYFLIKTINFIKGFNSDTISKDNIEKHKIELENDSKLFNKELNVVIFYIDSCIGDNQSKRLGKLYMAYIKKIISWDKFLELSEANKRLFETDYPLLEELYTGKKVEKSYQIERLISIGFVCDDTINGHGFVTNIGCIKYTLSSLGNIYLCIQKNID